VFVVFTSSERAELEIMAGNPGGAGDPGGSWTLEAREPGETDVTTAVVRVGLGVPKLTP
jgi:hypothetical protein